jgi:hypothetical protein
MVSDDDKKTSLSHDDVVTILTTALNQVLEWMPQENRSKALLIPDPRDKTKMCAVHAGHEGICILIDDGYDNLIEEFLCEDCQAKVHPFSVLYTGINTVTGEEDPEAYIGLYDGHDEDINAFEADELSLVEDDCDDAKAQYTEDDLSPKRTLN